MATINPTVNRTPAGAQSIAVTKWTMGGADTGNPVSLIDHADRSVQIEGTFGGATVTIQGSNDGTNWVTVSDASGTPLVMTARGLRQVLETTLYLRAITSGGTGSAIVVTLVGRSTNPLPSGS